MSTVVLIVLAVAAAAVVLLVVVGVLAVLTSQGQRHDLEGAELFDPIVLPEEDPTVLPEEAREAEGFNRV